MYFLVAAARGFKPRGMILFPPTWVSQFTKDPVMGLGSVVFAGSQAVDFYNDRVAIDTSPGVEARARAYEAEFLKTRPKSGLNAYQLEVLSEFPNGLEAEHLYEYRPVATCVT